MADIEFGVKGKNETIASIGQIEAAMKGLGISTVASTGAMAGGFKTLTAAMMANPIGLVVVGFTALTAAMVKCSGAAREDALAQNRLSAALGFTSSSLQKQSEELSKYYKITTGEIVNVQRLTANYFDNAKTIEKLTPVILNMATATGESTDSIAEQLSAAIKSGRGLRQYGIDLKDCKTEQERVEKIATILNGKFEDQAKAVLDLKSPLKVLGSGLLEAAGNVGKVILAFEKSAIVKSSVDFWIEQIDRFNSRFKENAKEIQEIDRMNNEIMRREKMLNFASDQKEKERLENELNLLKRQFNLRIDLAKIPKSDRGSRTEEQVPPPPPPDPEKEAKAEEEKLKLKISNLEKGIELDNKYWESKIKLEQEGINETLDLLKLQEINELSNFTIFKDDEIEIVKQKEQAREIIRKTYANMRAEAIDKDIKEQQEKREKENNDIQKLEFDLEESQINLISDASLRKEKLLDLARRKELSSLELNSTQRLLVEKKHSNIMEAFLREKNEKLEKDRDDAISKMKDMVGFTDEELGIKKNDSKQKKELIKKQKEELKELEKQNDKKLEINQQYLDAKEAMEKRHTREMTELTRQENFDKAMFAADYTLKMAGMMTDLAEKNAESAEERKRIAQAEALISGAQGSLGVVANTDKYLGTFGPVGGPIAMAAEIAALVIMTNVQLAQIQKAQFAYGGQASGRIVTGGKEGQDSVNATLMPGEIVYNPRFPNPALAQQVANTVPGMSSNNNGTTIGAINYSVNIQGNVDKTNIPDIEKAIEKGTLKALKKAQGKGQVYINKSGSLVIHG